MNLIELAETGMIPDRLIRIGIRRLLAQRIQKETPLDAETHARRLAEFASTLRDSPLAVHTADANVQHYEVPAEFFQHVLGPRLKYSCCLFPDASTTLEEAEQQMLALTCERAEITDGTDILELGCGWGSLSVWLGEHYPHARITAVSNSHSQRAFIQDRCAQSGVSNVNVVTADMRQFETDSRFDRIVSVEMFEHMRNYELLLRRIANWLKPSGKLWIHIFCHRELPYLFETEGATNWMGRHFFTGGMMPSFDLLSCFQHDLALEQSWEVNGLHYWNTCEAWLGNLDARRSAITRRFEQDLDRREARRQLQRWRIFFMACGELFRYGEGTEWFVGHYRMKKQ